MERELEKTAEELANIMVAHLSTMSPEERTARIKDGQNVLRNRFPGQLYSPEAISSHKPHLHEERRFG